ncbi:hypothetical protein C8Q80DRAFT_1272177 [Daedaleopsis nitida]|nr:hypothetical protein C8Q80DRAFT_1272177 [Daedaleopsis nitida]
MTIDYQATRTNDRAARMPAYPSSPRDANNTTTCPKQANLIPVRLRQEATWTAQAPGHLRGGRRLGPGGTPGVERHRAAEAPGAQLASSRAQLLALGTRDTAIAGCCAGPEICRRTSAPLLTAAAAAAAAAEPIAREKILKKVLELARTPELPNRKWPARAGWDQPQQVRRSAD